MLTEIGMIEFKPYLEKLLFKLSTVPPRKWELCDKGPISNRWGDYSKSSGSIRTTFPNGEYGIELFYESTQSYDFGHRWDKEECSLEVKVRAGKLPQEYTHQIIYFTEENNYVGEQQSGPLVEFYKRKKGAIKRSLESADMETRCAKMKRKEKAYFAKLCQDFLTSLDE